MLAYFILVVYGLTLVLVESKIAKPLREFLIKKVPFTRNLLKCMMCTGFWVGLFVSIFIFSPSMDLVQPKNIVHYVLYTIMDGFLASGVAYFIWVIQLKFE